MKGLIKAMGDGMFESTVLQGAVWTEWLQVVVADERSWLICALVYLGERVFFGVLLLSSPRVDGDGDDDNDDDDDDNDDDDGRGDGGRDGVGDGISKQGSGAT